MESSHIQRFFKVIHADLDIYCPNITNEERGLLLSKGMDMLKAVNYKISNVQDSGVFDGKDMKKHKNLFMCRKICESACLPHRIPDTFDVFFEKSSDMYSNYMKTLDYLQDINWDLKDQEQCIKYLRNCEYLLCWSNSSLLLRHVLEEDPSLSYNKNMITFGSPVLLPTFEANTCINIYHEDDWILGLVQALHQVDIAQYPLDRVHSCLVRNQKCNFLILSRTTFSDDQTEPHRCFHYFL